MNNNINWTKLSESLAALSSIERLNIGLSVLNEMGISDDAKKIIEEAINQYKNKTFEEKVDKYYLIEGKEDNGKRYYHILDYDAKNNLYMCNIVIYREKNDDRLGIYSSFKKLLYNSKAAPETFNNAKEIDKKTFDTYFTKCIGPNNKVDNITTGQKTKAQNPNTVLFFPDNPTLDDYLRTIFS